MTATKSFTVATPFYLESGQVLHELTIGFETLGSLNADRTNVVVVGHALTGNCYPAEWWSGLIGPGKLLDPQHYFIITPNHIGSCYGSTGPDSIDRRTGRSYLHEFPTLTTRDIARANLLLLDHLSLDHVFLGIGGSMGGMVLLEMACEAPQLFTRLVPIAITGAHSAWRLAFSSVIQKTIQAFGHDTESLNVGLRLARQIAMISYRSAVEFDSRFGRERCSDDPSAYYAPANSFEVSNYLDHQGDKLVNRFSPHSYLTLTRAMELYDLHRGRSQDALSKIQADVLCVGISTDVLYPELEVKAFSQLFTKSCYATLDAPFGHDSFLVADDVLADIVQQWLTIARSRKRTKQLVEVAV